MPLPARKPFEPHFCDSAITELGGTAAAQPCPLPAVPSLTCGDGGWSLSHIMGHYRQDFVNHIRHAFVLMGILSLHLLAIAALWSSLINPRLLLVPTDFQINVLPADKPKEPPPRLLPATLAEPQAIQVAAPEIDIPSGRSDTPRNRFVPANPANPPSRFASRRPERSTAFR
jgi:hypothetical protein